MSTATPTNRISLPHTVRELDEEEHVQAPQPDGIDGQEVAGNGRRRLRAQERRVGFANSVVVLQPGA
jgi:hypothetical protein